MQKKWNFGKSEATSVPKALPFGVDRLCFMLSLGKDFCCEANKVLRIHGTLANANLQAK